MSFYSNKGKVLTFSAIAWMKLQWFCHRGHTEIGGFAISSKHQPLYIDEFHTVKQLNESDSVDLDDIAVGEFTDECVDRKLQPCEFLRIWCHTHPGSSPEPSHADETTFREAFGTCDWAIMFILSRTDRTYARLKFNIGPGYSTELAVAVDWSGFPALVDRYDIDNEICNWQDEFNEHVNPQGQFDYDHYGHLSIDQRQASYASWQSHGNSKKFEGAETLDSLVARATKGDKDAIAVLEMVQKPSPDTTLTTPVAQAASTTAIEINDLLHTSADTTLDYERMTEGELRARYAVGDIRAYRVLAEQYGLPTNADIEAALAQERRQQRADEDAEWEAALEEDRLIMAERDRRQLEIDMDLEAEEEEAQMEAYYSSLDDFELQDLAASGDDMADAEMSFRYASARND